eukprot:scaffold1329_cov113-Skeletonema_marinoi.AAC.6
MTSSIPRVGTSLLLRSKYIIPQHLLSHRCACLETVIYGHQRNENVSSHFYNVKRKHSTATSKLYQKILLPQHGQNGTLLLRSTSKSIGQVDIIPQWRDDTLLELVPIVMSEDMENNSNDGNATNQNMSDNDSDVKEVQYDEESSSSEEHQTVTCGGLQFTLHRDGISTALRRKGSLVEVDVDVNASAAADNNEGMSSLSQWWKLVATVPEKSNITCNITKGNINVIGSKLEGDAHLATSDGDIKVSKLRGHDVTLNNIWNTSSNDTSSMSSSSPGLIYVQKGIEAQTVRISSSNRVRARMVNGSDVSVQVEVPSTSANEREEQVTGDDEQTENKLDEDDAGFRIDIGSLYISGSSECEARLNADEVDSSTGLVRVKSSHGHVIVHAKTKQNASLGEVKHQTNPFVDLGGVNGSCDVTLEVDGDSRDVKALSPTPHEAPVTTRVHFDSLSPDSISTIASSHVGGRSGEAIVSVTVDRKVEADLRLLAINTGAESMPINMDRLTSDELDDVESTLLDVEKCIQKSESYNTAKSAESISIETEAFDPVSESKELPESECYQYKQGTIRNRSGEPDSRFDIRSSPSRGKINIDSAASQALSGFQGKNNDSDSNADDNSHLPLLAVSTNGKIKLETLSWLGAIARRYGLEGQQELGRTASRRPRLS